MHLRSKPIKKGITPDKLAARSEGFSGAEIAAVCDRAALKAVRRAVAGLTSNPPKKVPVSVSRSDLEEAFAEMAEE
ncbi:MAG: hypothetical protein P8182_08220 [Deltaproteobacteria bacterium]